MAVVIVSVLSVAMMLLICRVLTNRSQLRTIAEDIRRVKTFIRSAKREGDVPSLQRHRRNRARVAGQQIRSELATFVVCTLLFAAVVAWCERYFRFQPPDESDRFTLQLELPAGRSGGNCHLVPIDGLTAQEDWVRKLRVESLPEGTRAVAGRILQAKAGRYALQIRVGELTVTHEITVGQRAASAVRIEHPGMGTTVVDHALLHPFGLPLWPWLYALTVVPGYLLGRRIA